MPEQADPGAATRAEPKVTAATATTGGVLGLIVVVLTALSASTDLLDRAPTWAVAVIGAALAVVTSAATYLRAYAAPHAARPDLPDRLR